ncbi:MAG: DUF5591 domain-containing protein [Methanophagales archaeon]|nr:DUF5591 domain-containing protein [Methanophagales archaeon]
MTRYYEVQRRDGAARIGLLTLNRGKGKKRQVHTPMLLRVSQEDLWDVPRAAVILPEVHPLFTKMEEAIPSLSLSVDCFVLSFASALLKSPRKFTRRIINARNMIPSDAALLVPAIATPSNAALLFYMGVDLIDDLNAVINGYQGIYQTEEGAVKLDADKLTDLPCNCSVCSSLSVDELNRKEGKEKASLIARHNTLLLDKELKKAKEHIRAGSLREYVEMRVRASPFLTAVLRIMDNDEVEYFEKRTPVARNHCMMVNTMESLKRVEVKRFAARVLERYEPPRRKILLLLPCSARKPYSISPSHLKFIEAIERYRGSIHEIILTSPLGVVPRELEVVYPAAFYDIPVTGYWDAEEREWVSSCLRAYLHQNLRSYGYEAIVAHLSGAYKEICSDVAMDLGIDAKITYTCKEGEDVRSKDALRRLKEEIAGICSGGGGDGDSDDKRLELQPRLRLSGWEKKASMLKAMADYQFGTGAGSELVMGKAGEGDRIRITGKFPSYKLSVNSRDHDVVLARIVPEYGLLALTVKGATRIEEFLSSYTVQIDDFFPESSGSILAPGVINASEGIRVNDEVIFTGKKAFGVGRAKMSGWEMVESRRGVAVAVREVVKIS